MKCNANDINPQSNSLPLSKGRGGRGGEAAGKAAGEVAVVSSYHIPVLLHESIDGLNIRKGGVYVDVTFGGGGHSREILRRIVEAGGGHLYSFDQDEDAERNLSLTLSQGEGTGNAYTEDTPSLGGAWGGFTFVRSNFRYLKNWMRYYDVEYIDGLLADLGVSSHHFDDETRGFSFRFDSPLDMRMNKRAGKTAAMIVNEESEERLADIFYLYGELKQARKIAALIVKARQAQPIRTTNELMAAVEPVFRRDREKKDMAKLFQALRIEVNHEMDALKEMLAGCTELLRPGSGRLSVITYHSLEDRIVKNMMKTGNVEGKQDKDFFGRVSTPYALINNKVVVPDAEEQQRNPRSRSAKLRIAEKL